jgi:hypothetical protein
VSLGQVVDELEASIHELSVVGDQAAARSAHPAGSSAAEGG